MAMKSFVLFLGKSRYSSILGARLPDYYLDDRHRFLEIEWTFEFHENR